MGLDIRFSILENVNLVANMESWPQENEKCSKKNELSASVDALFVVMYLQVAVALGLVATPQFKNPLPDALL